MSKFKITGGEKLKGEIEAYGAKNAVIKMIAAATLTNDEVVLKNVPDISDVDSMLEIFVDLGGSVKKEGGSVTLCAKGLKSTELSPRITKKIRASVVFAGPLLTRFGSVTMFHPGGCVIGSRPIDYHVKAFKQLGARISENELFYRLNAPKLIGDKVCFDDVSVTATENVLMAATLARGHTSIRLAAFEPEILDLVFLLNKMGAKIQTNSFGRFEIEGVKTLHGVEHTAIPDRIEAGTFAIIAAATGSNLTIKNFISDHNDIFLYKLKEIGVKFELSKDSLTVKPSSNLSATKIITRVYPGFPTDLQAPMSVLLTQAKGRSKIFETIFDSRLLYLAQLKKMGAKAKIENDHQAYIDGPTQLKGAKIDTLDLRAGATLVAAALTAEGESLIDGVEIIDRGYANLAERLLAVGAKIERVL